MKSIVINPYILRGGQEVARTIKAQYQQSSVANFIRQDGLGATGVVEYEEDIQVLAVPQRGE